MFLFLSVRSDVFILLPSRISHLSFSTGALLPYLLSPAPLLSCFVYFLAALHIQFLLWPFTLSLSRIFIPFTPPGFPHFLYVGLVTRCLLFGWLCALHWAFPVVYCICFAWGILWGFPFFHFTFLSSLCSAVFSSPYMSNRFMLHLCASEILTSPHGFSSHSVFF